MACEVFACEAVCFEPFPSTSKRVKCHCIVLHLFEQVVSFVYFSYNNLFLCLIHRGQPSTYNVRIFMEPKAYLRMSPAVHKEG